MSTQTVLKILLYTILVGLIGIFALSIFAPAYFEQLLAKAIIFLYQTFMLEGWKLLIVGFFVLLGLIKVLQVIVSLKPEHLPFHNYSDDAFKNVHWKWEWRGEKIEDLWCFCPTCNNPLTYNCDHLLFQTHFVCEKCEKELSIYDGDSINYVLARVIRDIKRIAQKDFDIEFKS